MKTIFKYELKADFTAQVVQMPEDAKMLHVHCQQQKIFLWAQVNLEKPVVDIPIHVIPTGGEFPDYADTRYIGTVHMMSLVFHVFQGVNAAS